jgi:hypothetical protein
MRVHSLRAVQTPYTGHHTEACSVNDEPLPLREGETSTTGQELEARRSARHELLGMVVLGATAVALGGVSVHYLIGNDQSKLAETGLSLSLVPGTFAFISGAMWWSDRTLVTYGPERPPRPPRPMTRRRWWLRAVGYWLATLPFSGLSLTGAYAAIYAAVRASWGAAGIWLAWSLVFGGLGVLLLAGSARLAPMLGLEPGARLSAAVRKSPAWRHLLWALFFWCLFTTFLAVSSGIQGKGEDCADFSGVALASWGGLFTGLRGKRPDNDDLFGM